MEFADSRAFMQSLTAVLGSEDAGRAYAAMQEAPSVSVRLNPFKQPSSPLPILEGASEVKWSSHGYILKERPSFTLHPLFHAGAYYVQDSSAMFVGHIFREMLQSMPDGHLRVLDLCAAPGGKTTDLSASLREARGDDFLLVSNEVMRQRAQVLSSNVAVWGDPCVAVTSRDPSAFSALEGFFDIIVVDAPCSGEGMFRKDQEAVDDWSPELVQMCASRQKRILADVWPALRTGGILIYSTCTFETAENDENLLWAASALGGEVIAPGDEFGIRTTSCGHLLVPGEVPGEGQWVGCLRKIEQLDSVRSSDREVLSTLRPLRFGINKGEMKGKDFVPDPDWIMSIGFDKEAYPCAEVDKETALHFLHKDTIVLPDAPKGYNVITYRGVPLGLVKNLGSRCNNLHPQSRRIRMDI